MVFSNYVGKKFLYVLVRVGRPADAKAATLNSIMRDFLFDEVIIYPQEPNTPSPDGNCRLPLTAQPCFLAH